MKIAYHPRRDDPVRVTAAVAATLRYGFHRERAGDREVTWPGVVGRRPAVRQLCLVVPDSVVVALLGFTLAPEDLP